VLGVDVNTVVLVFGVDVSLVLGVDGVDVSFVLGVDVFRVLNTKLFIELFE
jgi:hypothetical protein